MVQRRGQEARDHQLPDPAPGEGRAVLREDLRAHQGLGVLLRQVQARPVPGHHLRALRRRGHALQGAARAHGPHRAGRPRRPHLVPARHPELAGVPAHGHRGPRGAQGQAAGEGHLLRRQPRHLGRRRAPPRGPRRPRGRARRGGHPARAPARPRDRPALQGPREGASRARVLGGQGRRDQGPPALVGEGDRVGARTGRGRHRPGQARLRRVPRPLCPQDHRGRAAVARAQDPLRRLLRGRDGRRVHRQAHRPHRLRRRRDRSCARPSTPPTDAVPCRPSAARRPSSG